MALIHLQPSTGAFVFSGAVRGKYAGYGGQGSYTRAGLVLRSAWLPSPKRKKSKEKMLQPPSKIFGCLCGYALNFFLLKKNGIDSDVL